MRNEEIERRRSPENCACFIVPGRCMASCVFGRPHGQNSKRAKLATGSWEGAAVAASEYRAYKQFRGTRSKCMLRYAARCCLRRIDLLLIARGGPEVSSE
ncbi:unnamed protein product [Soboliphyme baturini]|uniref:DUF1472 domain-containing protein n=1 Tax=Soboliphyme baturini TaxID=241478 RepID=A0A183IZ62_9BILA|nr:unnamed protein product [Soboliphyme baturini]